MPTSLDAVRYRVQSGDDLSRIARQFGYTDWKAIYLSDCNSSLRKLRRDPNRIQAGDAIMLPPKTVDIRLTLRSRLNALRSFRRQVAEMYAQTQHDLDSSLETAQLWGEGVDVAAKILGILTHLGSITWKGMKAMGKVGKELAEANKELGKEAIKFSLDPAKDIGLELYGHSLNPEDSLLWAVPKIVVQSWNDMTSPSYWANVCAQLRSGSSWSTATTVTVSDVHTRALSHLKDQRDMSLRSLDTKITETNRLLGFFSIPVATSLPLKAKP